MLGSTTCTIAIGELAMQLNKLILYSPKLISTLSCYNLCVIIMHYKVEVRCVCSPTHCTATKRHIGAAARGSDLIWHPVLSCKKAKDFGLIAQYNFNGGISTAWLLSGLGTDDHNMWSQLLQQMCRGWEISCKVFHAGLLFSPFPLSLSIASIAVASNSVLSSAA